MMQTDIIILREKHDPEMDLSDRQAYNMVEAFEDTKGVDIVYVEAWSDAGYIWVELHCFNLGDKHKGDFLGCPCGDEQECRWGCDAPYE